MTEPIPPHLQCLAPGATRLLAPNPSPMTYWGTNSYLLGETRLAVIDPGPNDPAHLEALLAAIDGRKVEAILVSHAHVDHSPLAPALAAQTGAPVLAFGDAQAGRSAIMTDLAARGMAHGGEGVDGAFMPDETLADGARITSPEWQIEVLHTPGHFGNHLCFAWGDRLFCGDHLMGWASSLVSPPDGDLTDFMASSARLAARNWSVAYPGHGAPIADPAERLAWLMAHRRDRETQILTALVGEMPLPALTAAVYDDVAPALLPMAARNLFAHLVDLWGRGLISAHPELSEGAIFAKKMQKALDLADRSG